MNARQRRARERALFRYMWTYSTAVCVGCKVHGTDIKCDEDGLCVFCGADVIVVTGPTGAAAVGPLLDALNVDHTVRDYVRSSPGLEHVTVASDLDLLSKLVRTIGADRRRAPRWSHVGAYLGHGSGVSQAICRVLNLDPNELVGDDEDLDDGADLEAP